CQALAQRGMWDSRQRFGEQWPAAWRVLSPFIGSACYSFGVRIEQLWIQNCLATGSQSFERAGEAEISVHVKPPGIIVSAVFNKVVVVGAERSFDLLVFGRNEAMVKIPHEDLNE